MAAADYRLMTEATGQRIAAALEALSGTSAAAAAARANLDVYSTGEVDAAIQQSTSSLGDPITVAHGGRGMSTSVLDVTSSYTTLASAINSIRSTVAFPISFIKAGLHTISDLPSDKTTREFAGICFGDFNRMQVLIFIYSDTGKPYYRQLFNGNWLNDWVQM